MSDTDKIVLTFQRPSLAFKAKPETIKTHNNPKISEWRDQYGFVPGIDPAIVTYPTRHAISSNFSLPSVSINNIPRTAKKRRSGFRNVFFRIFR